MSGIYVYFRRLPICTGIAACALLLLAATVVAAEPERAAVLPDVGLPQFAAPGNPVLMSAELPPWLEPSDTIWNRNLTVDWNTRFRPARYAGSLVTEINTWLADSPDDEEYLEDSRVIEFSQTVRFEGVILPGISVGLEAGIATQQIRPDGESGYDRYKFSYRVGGSFKAGVGINEITTFCAELGFYTWEGRANDQNNAQVIANNGNQIFLRAYALRIDASLAVELIAQPHAASFSVFAGGSFVYTWNRLVLDDSTLSFRQRLEDSFGFLFGFVLGINETFTLSAEGRLLGIVAGRLSLAIWF